MEGQEDQGNQKKSTLKGIPPSYLKGSLVLLAFLLASPLGSLKLPKIVLT